MAPRDAYYVVERRPYVLRSGCNACRNLNQLYQVWWIIPLNENTIYVFSFYIRVFSACAFFMSISFTYPLSPNVSGSRSVGLDGWQLLSNWRSLARASFIPGSPMSSSIVFIQDFLGLPLGRRPSTCKLRTTDGGSPSPVFRTWPNHCRLLTRARSEISFSPHLLATFELLTLSRRHPSHKMQHPSVTALDAMLQTLSERTWLTTIQKYWTNQMWRLTRIPFLRPESSFWCGSSGRGNQARNRGLE